MRVEIPTSYLFQDRNTAVLYDDLQHIEVWQYFVPYDKKQVLHIFLPLVSQHLPGTVVGGHLQKIQSDRVSRVRLHSGMCFWETTLLLARDDVEFNSCYYRMMEGWTTGKNGSTFRRPS